MWSAFERGSSPVDWCESNYSVSPVIAEFINTVSSALFILLPPVQIHLFQQYSKFFNPAINILWLIYIAVGIGSMYFHATLSLAGQLLDELTIVWQILAATAILLPKRHFPRFLSGNRRRWAKYLSVVAVIVSGFLTMYPAFNPFFLMVTIVPTCLLINYEIKRNIVNPGQVHRLGLRCLAVILLAVTCWIMDQLFCDVWRYINFPYLHGFWHVLALIASYIGFVTMAYINALDEVPEQTPQLRYWPVNEFEFGVPYVTIANPRKKNLNMDFNTHCLS